MPGRDAKTQAADLPIMLYLPGIDGTGLAASRQFPSLVEAFDLTALSIPGSDRTPFPDLVKLVVYAPCLACCSLCSIPRPVTKHWQSCYCNLERHCCTCIASSRESVAHVA